MKQKVIIDTDPGIDDAMAILLMVNSKVFNLLAITTVAGNKSIQEVTNNASYVLGLTDLEVPIYSGSLRPLKSKLIKANVHGEGGLGGVKVDTKFKLSNDADDRIAELVRKNPGEVTILAIGPLTNIARAFIKDPKLPLKIKQIVIMGGAIDVPGNKSRVAEFNIYVDPEAAKIVFNSEVSKVLIPLDVCIRTPLFMKDFEKLKKTRYYEFIMKIMRKYIKALKKYENLKGALVYDALAAYYLINKSAFFVEAMDVRVETKGEFTRGMTVADKTSWGKKIENIKVAKEVNRNQFVKGFIEIMASN